MLCAEKPYKDIKVVDGGTIHGTVHLVGDASKAVEMPITKDEKVCGKKKPSPRLTVGKNGGVQNAVISLMGIDEGKKAEAPKVYPLNQTKCEYAPHVLILPQGSSMEIVNNDPIMHNVHAYDLLTASKTVFNIAQPIKGQRMPINPKMVKAPGLMLETCDAGHPWMSAYVIIAEHPYYALTDANGKFVLSDVPAGTYTLRMWHEGVAIVTTEMEHGVPKKYSFEDPYEVKKDVTVSPRETVEMDIDLVLR